MKICISRRGGSRRQGSALITTLVISGVIGLMLASYLSLVSAQNRATARSQAWNGSIAILEAGIEEALTHLYHAGPSYTDWGTDGWWAWNNSHYKWRSLNGHYAFISISNTSPPVIYATGYSPVELQSIYVQRTVRVNTKQDGMFVKGMVAKGQIDMNGNNVETDSFDSADPAYSTGGRYDPAKTKDNGDVATNSGLVNSVSVGNANIKGTVSTGPGGSVSIGSNGAVGSAAWHAAGNSGAEPGYLTDDMNVSFPDVTVPFVGGYFTPSSGTVGGTNYTYVLSTGNYQMSSLSMSGKKNMIVTGDAVLFVTGNVSMSGKAYIAIDSGASLNMYVGGSSASLGGNGVINHNGNAQDFFYWGLNGNTSLSMSGNGEFTGVIYAPYADLSLSGGGSGDNDFIGASVTKTVTMNGHFKFHYDEELGRIGPSRGFVVIAWNEI